MARQFGWDLPPGVTQKMIDDHFGAGVCVPCNADDHDNCEPEGCRCLECDERARDDAAEVAYEAWKEQQYEQEEPEFDYGPDD